MSFFRPPFLGDCNLDSSVLPVIMGFQQRSLVQCRIIYRSLSTSRQHCSVLSFVFPSFQSSTSIFDPVFLRLISPLCPESLCQLHGTSSPDYPSDSFTHDSVFPNPLAFQTIHVKTCPSSIRTTGLFQHTSSTYEYLRRPRVP